MKILIATGIYPPEIGGPATVMAELVEELRKLEHEVEVVTHGIHGHEFGVTRVPRAGGILARYVRMCHVIREHLGADTVLFATDIFSIGIPARCALVGRPNWFVLRLGGEWMWEDAVTNGGLRVTLRDYWTKHAFGFHHWMKRALASWILRRADTIAVTSDILRDPIQHISAVCETRIITVPNVTSQMNTMPTAHLEDGTLRVLYAGRFAPVKNLPFFCCALKQAYERGARISMVFIGDGRERAECEEILSGVPHVRFLGSKAPHDVLNLLSETDLYVLPSLSDVCPNGVLEALGCGVPCLVTSEHGLPSEVGGMMELDPTNEAVWTEALVRLASDRSILDGLRRQIRLPAPSAFTLASVVTSSAPSR